MDQETKRKHYAVFPEFRSYILDVRKMISNYSNMGQALFPFLTCTHFLTHTLSFSYTHSLSLTHASGTIQQSKESNDTLNTALRNIAGYELSVNRSLCLINGWKATSLSVPSVLSVIKPVVVSYGCRTTDAYGAEPWSVLHVCF